MSVLELFAYFENHPVYLLVYTGALPLLSLIIRLGHGQFRAALPPWKYFYSGIVYLSCIPGIFVLFAVGYLSGFRRENLLALDIVVYVLPVLSMIATLFIVRKSIHFDDIPGFHRITGLIAVTAATFAILFVLDRLRILLFFRASVLWFLLLGFGIFVALRIGGRLIFARKR